MRAKTLRCNNRGQALLEFCLLLPFLLSLFFIADLLGTLIISSLKVEAFQHHLLFQALRENEGVHFPAAPEPDPLHLSLQVEAKGFSGRKWLERGRGKVLTTTTVKPNFPLGFYDFLDFHPEAPPQTKVILVDPWHQHPFKYVTWAIAEAIVLGESLTADRANYLEFLEGTATDFAVDHIDFGALLKNLDYGEIFSQVADLANGEEF